MGEGTKDWEWGDKERCGREVLVLVLVSVIALAYQISQTRI